jgi:transcriptional regulator with XRE-family HTH domain
MDKKKGAEKMPDSVFLISDTPPAFRLRQAREAKGLTQTELANKVHTIYQRIHEWESSWKVPSDKYYSKLAEVLDVDPTWLKEGRMDKAPRFLYESYSLDKEKLSDEEFKFRNQVIAWCARDLSHMDYKTLLTVSHLISITLRADRIINDPEFREKVEESVKDGKRFTISEFENGSLSEIQKLLDLASEKSEK